MPALLPDELVLGPVHVKVTDLGRSIPFYERALGLTLAGRANGTAALAAGDHEVLHLHERPEARPPGRHAGLYHFALLHPSREELARAAQRLVVTRTPISGASDHGVSEAIYLADPDDNGIELAADRPRSEWVDLHDPTTMAPKPLDMNGLLRLVDGQDARSEVHPDLGVGHLHLHVGDLDGAVEFYRDGVGFEVMAFGPSAAFISAGGYHHHLGLNTWRGEGAPPAPDDAVGLDHWTVVLPRADDVAATRARLEAAGAPLEGREGGFLTRDPWNNGLVVTSP